MDTFHSRSHLHDKIGIPYVQSLLKQYGLQGHPYGIENFDSEMHRALMLYGRDNLMALKERYKPDLYIVPQPNGMKINPNVKPIFCEVKCEEGQHKNFAIEFDSYCAAKEWDNGQRNVIYIFVKVEHFGPAWAKAGWIDNVYSSPVFVPRRFDFEKNITELSQKYPQYSFYPKEHLNGSGTPYFLVKQNSLALKYLDAFISQMFELPPVEQLVLF